MKSEAEVREMRIKAYKKLSTAQSKHGWDYDPTDICICNTEIRILEEILEADND